MPKAAHPTKLRGRWRIRWIDEHDERQSAVFDTDKEAEYQLGLRKVEAEERRRGLRAAAVEPRKFDAICTYWLEKRAARKRSQADDESIIKRHLRPAFGQLLLADVGVEEVDEFVVERDHLNPKTVANHLTLLISLMRLAHELGWLAALPRIKKPKVQLFSTDFRYLRTKDEVRRFLAAAREDELLRLVGKLGGEWWKKFRGATTPTLLMVRTGMLFGDTARRVHQKAVAAGAVLREVLEEFKMVGAVLIYDELMWQPPAPDFVASPEFRLSIGSVDGFARATLVVPNPCATLPFTKAELEVLVARTMRW